MVDGAEYLGDTPFFSLVEMPRYRGGSLEVASGVAARRSGFETSLVEEVETAWRKPFAELRCSEVLTLLWQRMGLEWLARPIVAFVSLYPEAECTNYPGEMLAGMLRAREEFGRHAQPEFGLWLRQDMGWLEQLFGWNKRLYGEILENLQQAEAYRV